MILAGDGVGISSSANHSGPEGDRAFNESSLTDGQCVMASV